MSNDDDNKKNGKKDYDVGYGKPPKNRQFGAKDGNPRNDKGRPPGRNILEFDRLSEEALWYCFHETAQKAVSIREDGEELVIPLIMALAKGMARDALSGDKHARKEYLRSLEKAVKGKDKLLAEMHSILADYRERKLSAMQNPGSLECFDTFYGWFMSKKHLRDTEGKDHWPYEEAEPITDKDWKVFIRQHKHLKANPMEVLPWPPKYPSHDLEESEDTTPQERAREYLKVFRHRKEMREKEGPVKWPYLCEEPVDEKDWEHFERYIQDIIDEKKDPSQWPPSYWDDEPEALEDAPPEKE